MEELMLFGGYALGVVTAGLLLTFAKAVIFSAVFCWFLKRVIPTGRK